MITNGDTKVMDRIPLGVPHAFDDIWETAKRIEVLAGKKGESPEKHMQSLIFELKIRLTRLEILNLEGFHEENLSEKVSP